MELDGWTLDDGVELHREFPATFWIPAIWRRYLLRRNQLVKLIFRIGLRDDQAEESVEVERMWVIVTRRSGWGRYEGVFDNDPVFDHGHGGRPGGGAGGAGRGLGAGGFSGGRARRLKQAVAVP